MLPRRSRIPRSSFDRLFKAGARTRLPYGQVLFTSAPDFKASVVIGKKVEPTAVGRNRLRRRLYTAFKVLAAEGITGHFVIVTTPQVTTLPFTMVADGFCDAMRALSRRPGVR